MITRILRASFLPHLLLICWLTFVAFTTWQHVKKTDLPPIFDATEYFLKAKNFWANLHDRRIHNPLNLEPTFRPPGTVVMSYPFGFNTDFHPYFFRSIFFPLLCMAAAVYVVGSHGPNKGSTRWNLALLAIFVTSLPTFYHFERVTDDNSGLCWGLVDNFFAGIACLAAAALMRSLKTLSLRWLIAGSLLAGFCVLVKPAGAVIMLLLSAVWFMALLVRLAGANVSSDERTQVVKMLVRGSLCVTGIEGTTLALCRASHYLSTTNIAYGKDAMRLLRAEWAPSLTPGLMYWQIRPVLGSVFPCMLAAFAVLAIAYWKRIQDRQANWAPSVLWGMVLSAAVCLATGVWFWLAFSAISQVRYFTPFPLIAFVCVIPIVLRVLEVMPRWAEFAFRLAWITPAFVLAILLLQTSPSLKWQHVYGANLASGVFKDETAQARDVLEWARKTGRDARIYTFGLNSERDVAFFSLGTYELVRNPSLPSFVMMKPEDQRKGAAYRIDDILASDFLAFTPVSDNSLRTSMLARAAVPDISQENLLFQSWLSTLSENDGVRFVSETQKIRVLALEDCGKFVVSVNKLVAEHFWSTSFQEMNPVHSSWTEHELSEWAALSSPAVNNVRFGDTFLLHALSYRRAEDKLRVRVWWQPTQQNLRRGWIFFIYALDHSGKAVTNTGVPLGCIREAQSDRPIRLSVTTIDDAPYKHITQLAVGFFSPPGTVLKADKGLRDWENSRLIVPLNETRQSGPLTSTVNVKNVKDDANITNAVERSPLAP